MTTGKQVTPMQQVCQSLDKMKDKFEQALPEGLSVAKFIKNATNAIQTHPQKEKLLNANRQSLYNACQKAAIDGLMLDGREAALVVFGQDVTYMPMTQGLIKLARNSGEIGSIVSEVVYTNDKFTCYHDENGTTLKHEPNWFEDRGDPILVWASVKLKNGETIIRAIAKEKIMRIASKSNNKYQYDPVKGPHFDEWWRKTVIKNVLKYAPKSTQLENTLSTGNHEEFGYEDAEPKEPRSAKSPVKRKTKAEKVIEEASAEPEVLEAEIVEETILESSDDIDEDGEEIVI